MMRIAHGLVLLHDHRPWWHVRPRLPVSAMLRRHWPRLPLPRLLGRLLEVLRVRPERLVWRSLHWALCGTLGAAGAVLW